jgi:hypothetical protein
MEDRPMSEHDHPAPGDVVLVMHPTPGVPAEPAVVRSPEVIASIESAPGPTASDPQDSETLLYADGKTAVAPAGDLVVLRTAAGVSALLDVQWLTPTAEMHFLEAVQRARAGLDLRGAQRWAKRIDIAIAGMSVPFTVPRRTRILELRMGDGEKPSHIIVVERLHRGDERERVAIELVWNDRSANACLERYRATPAPEEDLRLNLEGAPDRDLGGGTTRSAIRRLEARMARRRRNGCGRS